MLLTGNVTAVQKPPVNLPAWYEDFLQCCVKRAAVFSVRVSQSRQTLLVLKYQDRQVIESQLKALTPGGDQKVEAHFSAFGYERGQYVYLTQAYYAGFPKP
jgi:hypothetical protein